jgi:iron complex outermembrane receptor protein
MKTLLPFARNLLAVSAALGVSAVAQEAALEEVIVTAEKRTQSLQDVPISILAFDQDRLETLRINELDDLNANVPNLFVNNFNNDPVAVRLFIRGIGQNDLQLTQDPSVALYLDGVYIGTSFGAGFEGVDTERIEVLRGPQGTLYGRNATGGAVNIVTRRASTEAFTFHQTLTGGNLDLFQSRTFLNVPLGERFAVKVGYLYTDRGGYVDNNGVGDDFGTNERESAVVDLRWEAADSLTFDYRYENATIEDTGRVEQAIRAGDPAELPPGVPDLSFATTPGTVSRDLEDEVTALWDSRPSDVDIEAHTLHVGWELGEHWTFKSITASRELDSYTYTVVMPDWTVNLVPGGGAVSTGINDIDFDQFSQEFQLLGTWDRWELTSGIYYYDDDGTHDSTPTQGLGLPPPEFDITETENESLAVYAQATWTPGFMDSRWHFTLGARYSEDERKAFRRNTRSAEFAASAPDGAHYDNDFSNFNPALTVGFDLSDDANVYAKVVSGYKSGGTSTRSANATLFQGGFDEEDVISYELGYKAEFLDRRARLNTALFYMEMDGLQTSIQTGGTPGERDFLPIDDNTIQGLEFDFVYAVSGNITASLSYGYLDTELGEDAVETVAGTFNLVDVYAYAPEHSGTVALDYNLPLKNGGLGAHLGYSYQDESEASVNAADGAIINDRNLLDASISWYDVRLGDLPGALKLQLWGKNLTDDEYYVVNTAAWAFVGANEVATFGDPRTYGLTLTYDY